MPEIMDAHSPDRRLVAQLTEPLVTESPYSGCPVSVANARPWSE